MKQDSYEVFGFKVLGPVINGYLAKLHAYISCCDDAGHKFLFATRAGVRIHYAYQVWLQARKLPVPDNVELIKLSRLLAIKAAYLNAPALAVTSLGQEMGGAALGDIVRSVLAPEIRAGRTPDFDEIEQLPLHEFIKSDSWIARNLHAYLAGQATLYQGYLKGIVGTADRVILVDSGWRGTSQLLLERAFPEYEWAGLYFGCIGRSEVLGVRPGEMHGLVFDAEHYDSGKPETAFVMHRHLVESLFEPAVPSFEVLEADDLQRVPGIDDYLAMEQRVDPWDGVYDGVLRYLRKQAQQPLTDLLAGYHAALRELADRICFPERRDLRCMAGKHRSHDLGREGACPTIVPAQDRHPGDSAHARIADAIWSSGQAAAESEPAAARKIQLQIVGSYRGTPQRDYLVAHPQAGPMVAIITRTKDRPLLLERAAESVAAQTYQNYVWVVVNDGGNVDDVIAVIEASTVSPLKVVLCSNSSSLGMEAASNVGICNSSSEYIVIHDDDDSWHPEFLQESVAYLQKHAGVYAGVITKTLYVSEEIVADKVIEHGRWPYNDWVENVHLAEMAIGNFFAPIAFVFRREIYDSVGGFDEKLPVLGDWDFNLRFLLKADIGVLPRALACYHHRDRGSSDGSYSNSVIGGIGKHAAYHSVVRNKYLRNAGSGQDYGALSVLVGTAYAHSDTRSRLDNSRLNEDLERLKEQVGQLQSLADNRWVMVQAMASEIARLSGGGISQVDVIGLVERGLERYALSNGLMAPPDFNSSEYCRIYPDVAKAVAGREIESAFSHYVRHGRHEGRHRT